MTKIVSFLTLIITVFVCLLPAAPALAQRDRVFVASYGSDSNPCTFGSPCKTFQNAVNVVAVGGEVTAIDSAGFGPISITKAVTITSPAGVEAGIAAANGNAINITAPGATVKLHGLTIEGPNAAYAGIAFASGSYLEIVDCSFSNFSDGISIATSATTSILISNTIVTGAFDVGILLDTGGSGTITAALDHVTLSNNYFGLDTQAEGGPIEASITDSHTEANSYGIVTGGASSSSVSSVILKNVMLNQDGAGIAMNPYSLVYLSQVTQTSAPGLLTVAIGFAANDSAAISDGSNHLMGSISGGGSLSSWTAN